MMRRLLAATFLALSLFVGGAVAVNQDSPTKVAAASIAPTQAPVRLTLDMLVHHAGVWLPGDITTFPAQHRAMARGYFTYCFDAQAAAYPNFRAQAREVVEYAFGRTGIPAREVAWDSGAECDVRNEMPSDAIFLTGCGDGAAACIQYWSLPVSIKYRRALNYFDWKTTFCHEGNGNTGHLMGMHEHYDDINFRSLGRTWTCMDFGTGTWALPDYDRDRIFNAFVPDAPDAVSLSVTNGRATVSWSQFRKDGGAARANNIRQNTSATRMSFGYATCDGCPVEWAGNTCGQAFNFCFTDYGTGFRSFDSFWRGCIYVRAENPLTVFIPQISAPDFWTKAGCW